jgi:hypothetical protein
MTVFQGMKFSKPAPLLNFSVRRQRCSMVAGTILQDNLEPFLTTLSWLIGYSIDEDDWQAINNDLLDGGGGSYEFVGNQTMKFDVALDGNTSVMKVTVAVPEELESQVELAVAIFQQFRLRKHPD